MNMADALGRLLSPIKRSISNMIVKAVLEQATNNETFPLCKVQLSENEAQDEVELLLPYGIISFPKGDASVLVLNINGDRNQPIAIMAADRTGIPSNAEGDTGIYNADGTYILLNGDAVKIVCSGKVEVTCNQLDVNNGNLTVD